MKQRTKKHCITGLVCFILSATCITPSYSEDKPEQIQAYIGFVDVNAYPLLAKKVNPMRLTAIRETATHLGATGALAYRSLQINCALNKEAYYLDHVFNFNRLLLPHHVLPPVIVQADNSLNLADNNTIRGDAKTYKIVDVARFITTAPTWRDYLFMNFKKPKLPDHTLLPTTQSEALAWNTYIKEGWESGMQQADEIFGENLNRLKRDFNGMVIFRKLLAQHMVSAPFVAQSSLGITGNENELHIGDHIARITNPAKLETNSRNWQPVPIVNNG